MGVTHQTGVARPPPERYGAPPTYCRVMEFRASPGRPSTTDEVDRITLTDLTTLGSDRGPSPMNIAAVLVVEGGAPLETRVVLSALEAGTVAVPRLRQRLRSAPRGWGRP